MKASAFKAKHGSAWQAELRKMKADESRNSDRRFQNEKGTNVPSALSASSVAKFLERCDSCEHRIGRSAKLPNGHCRAIIERTGKRCDKSFMAWLVNGRCPKEEMTNDECLMRAEGNPV